MPAPFALLVRSEPLSSSAALSSQPALPGFEPDLAAYAPDQPAGPRHGRERHGYGLWAAVFPQPEDARRIIATAMPAVRPGFEHCTAGAPLLPERLHITLQAIAAGPDPPPRAIVSAAVDAAGAVAVPPIPIVFDRMQTFANSGARVLLCTAGCNAAIARLRHTLALMLRRRQLRSWASGTPHMTIRYDRRQAIPEQPIEPICWTATRFALVLSHVGIGHHEWIGQWALRSGRH